MTGGPQRPALGDLIQAPLERIRLRPEPGCEPLVWLRAAEQFIAAPRGAGGESSQEGRDRGQLSGDHCRFTVVVAQRRSHAGRAAASEMPRPRRPPQIAASPRDTPMLDKLSAVTARTT